MRITCNPVVRAAAIAAIVAVPALALGQTQQNAQPNPAADHLAASRAALNKVLTAPAPNGDAFKKLSEIKTEYLALEKAASTRAKEWETHFQNIDRLVGDLLSPTPASAEAGAVGTSGTSPSLAPGVSTSLVEFRKELRAFKDAMKGGSTSAAAGTAGTATASAPAAAAPPPATAPPPAAAPPATAEPPAASAPPASAPPATAEPPSTSSPGLATSPRSISAPAPMPATADATVLAQLDQLTGTIDAMLKASADESSGKVTLDRKTLEGLKAQIDQIKQNLKK
jgi:hypothetical protein